MQGMRRPKAVVVPASALVPPDRLVQPPPNWFTHVVHERQPYYYDARPGRRPDGEFAEGTPVVLMVHDRGGLCRVVDGQGLYVTTAFEGLSKLSSARDGKGVRARAT